MTRIRATHEKLGHRRAVDKLQHALVVNCPLYVQAVRQSSERRTRKFVESTESIDSKSLWKCPRDCIECYQASFHVAEPDKVTHSQRKELKVSLCYRH